MPRSGPPLRPSDPPAICEGRAVMPRAIIAVGPGCVLLREESCQRRDGGIGTVARAHSPPWRDEAGGLAPSRWVPERLDLWVS